MKAKEYRGPDSQAVRQMFAGIAHRYDFLNHFLSGSTDRYWRRIAVNKVQELLRGSASQLCLDVCSGTGDLALALHRRLGVSVIASDFCHPMLARANLKFAGQQSTRPTRRLETVEADALDLPFADSTFDAVTIAFGLRNLEDPFRGIQEFLRLLKPRGGLVILEFSRPVVPVLRHVFNGYFRYILPQLGAAISGDGTAYQYLPDSVRRFPHQAELSEMLSAVGFRDVAYKNLTGGVAALHWGLKPGGTVR